MEYKSLPKTGTKRSIEVSVALLLIIVLISLVSASGGGSSSNAVELFANTCYWDDFDELGLNWYYLESSKASTIEFRLYNIEDSDLNLYLFDEDEHLIGYSHNSGDEDESYTYIKSNTDYEKLYLAIDVYELTGEGYGVIEITESCSYYADYYCGSGNKVWKEGQTSNCNIFDDFVEDCDDNDDDGTWSSSQCINGDIKRRRVSKDYFCSSGDCDYTTTTEYITIKECDVGCSSGDDVCYDCTSDSHCDSGEKCSNNECVTKTCSDFGLNSCSVGGGYTKHTDSVFKCKDQYPWWSFDELLCWEPISSLGDGDYCSIIDCTHGEHDCEWNSQCQGDNLFCRGPWIGGDGCCYDNEDWDSENNKCELVDGESCTADDQCFGKYCVHEVCASTKWVEGDGECDESQGETCSNSEDDCGKCNLEYCNEDDECYGGNCVHNVCWDNPWIVGDYYCDSSKGENPDNSEIDCFQELVVLELIDYPTRIEQGEEVTVRARLENIGTYGGQLKLEAGIEPDYWPGGFEQTINSIASESDLGVMSYYPIAKCCPGNDYYDAVEITLAPGEQEIVTFNFIAPTIHTVDDCDIHKRTAWDTLHQVGVGLYEECGQGYDNYKASNLIIEEKYCGQNADCDYNEYCERGLNLIGVCRPGYNCVDDCRSIGFSCEGINVLECGQFDTDICLDKRIISCLGRDICIGGTCTEQDSVTKLELDYSGRNDITINKQPGDILLLNLIYKGTETVEIEYDESALTLSGCSKQFTITTDTSCNIKIDNDANEGRYTVGIKNGEKGTLKVIDTPKTLIITDKNRLIQRYGSEEEVKALLAQAYKTAYEEDGIVYNLDDYLDNSMLWDSFNEYSGGEYK